MVLLRAVAVQLRIETWFELVSGRDDDGMEVDYEEGERHAIPSPVHDA